MRSVKGEPRLVVRGPLGAGVSVATEASMARAVRASMLPNPIVMRLMSVILVPTEAPWRAALRRFRAAWDSRPASRSPNARPRVRTDGRPGSRVSRPGL